MPSYLGVWSLALVTPVTVQTQPLAQEALGGPGGAGQPRGTRQQHQGWGTSWRIPAGKTCPGPRNSPQDQGNLQVTTVPTTLGSTTVVFWTGLNGLSASMP